MKSSEIRNKFLEFFRSKGHLIVPSASIVVKNDPTLMFTNAGMNQFKDYFLGNKEPVSKRVADTQKCLRVSGKHNDLEEVGVDTYHHTMFEMLGNWSFGDYFKEDAIKWSWELLTEVYKIPKDRLYVSIFEGDEKERLPRDIEAENEWKKYIDADRILPFKKKDNFWEMGDTGPCGPCTEIHVDCRTDEERRLIPGHQLVNGDNPEVIEIWNNVFIQFNRLKDGSLEPLPSRHVDTGMGFERLTRVIQGKTSNYDTDIFSEIISTIERITGKEYTAGQGKRDIAFRVIADHIRAIAFTISDGQLPSNTGAGYVIRRILRRAVRYYYSYLGFKNPLLHLLVKQLADQFINVFPELKAQNDFVERVIKEEEEAFLRTLEKGLKKIDELIQGSATSGMLNGAAVFELYDTYGFPVDLTRLIASENNLQIDEEGFSKEMQIQKERSRAATSVDTGDWIILSDKAQSTFVGYTRLNVRSRVTRYRKITSKGKQAVQLVLEETPFYAESGGQVGDTGYFDFDGEKIEVLNTKKENDLTVHFTDKLPTNINAEVEAQVDIAKRKSTAIHHSATHLLHAALRSVLGTHVAQKGSLVAADYLRFDFSHFAKMSSEEIRIVEGMVNEKIRENIPVVTRELPRAEAIGMGAMALFGEKYGEMVRVVLIDPNYSIELCGGTHVGRTGELGYFKILNESAVAAGVRRVEAISGKSAEDFISKQSGEITEIRELLKNPIDLPKAVVGLQSENNDLRKKLERMEAMQLGSMKAELIQKKLHLNGINFIGEIVEVGNAEALKKLCFDLKDELENYVVVLAAKIDGKPQIAVMVADSLIKEKGIDAPTIIKKEVAPLIKGGGGGQPTLATAGGQDASNLPLVINKIKAIFSQP